MKSKICLIVAYYGKFPLWMPAFYLSCKYNPSIDWIIITDIEKPTNIPENIKFVNMNLMDLNSLIAKKICFDFQIQENFVYKICDFKPGYGLIFNDLIDKYDYWGHCDIDIIWGDISSFLEKEELVKYDIFTSRIGKIAGHFCLYRNIPEINNLFFEIPHLRLSLKKVKKYCGVDEKFLSNLLHKYSNENFFKKMKKYIARSKRYEPKIYWDKILASPGYYQRILLSNKEMGFHWKNGKIYHVNGEELMYIHFHKLKANIQHIGFSYNDQPDNFVLRYDGIYLA